MTERIGQKSAMVYGERREKGSLESLGDMGEMTQRGRPSCRKKPLKAVLEWATGRSCEKREWIRERIGGAL